MENNQATLSQGPIGRKPLYVLLRELGFVATHGKWILYTENGNMRDAHVVTVESNLRKTRANRKLKLNMIEADGICRAVNSINVTDAGTIAAVRQRIVSFYGIQQRQEKITNLLGE